MPDALSPEWAEYESRWSVNAADFESPLSAAQFLVRRKRIFNAAAAIGIPKDMLSLFSPDKPGFEDRVAKALGSLLDTVKHAAE